MSKTCGRNGEEPPTGAANLAAAEAALWRGDAAAVRAAAQAAGVQAQAGGDPYGAARALHNRGTLLHHLHEHEAARHCLRDAVARYEALPQRATYGWFVRVGLAMNRLDHARQPAECGQPGAARTQRRLAAWVMPP